jgi:hypothetical protein
MVSSLLIGMRLSFDVLEKVESDGISRVDIRPVENKFEEKNSKLNIITNFILLKE